MPIMYIENNCLGVFPRWPLSEITCIKGPCAIWLHNWLTALKPPFPGADSGNLVNIQHANNAYVLSLIYQFLFEKLVYCSKKKFKSCLHQRIDPKWTRFAHLVGKITSSQNRSSPSQHLCTKASLMSWSGWPFFNIWCCNWMPRTDPSILWLKWALIFTGQANGIQTPSTTAPIVVGTTGSLNDMWIGCYQGGQRG